jgi:nuclear pore complex protein Nup155
LTTPTEIKVLGVGVKDSNSAEADKMNANFVLYLTQIVISTDGVPMIDITSTKDGRIFLGGKDGHLYELEYEVDLVFPVAAYDLVDHMFANTQSEEGWFKRRCSLKNLTQTSLASLIPTFITWTQSG